MYFPKYFIGLIIASVFNHQTNWFYCVAGNYNRGHGSTTGLWPGQRPCLCSDGCTKSAVRPWTVGLLQIREAAHDPHEESVGREGVERPME